MRFRDARFAGSYPDYKKASGFGLSEIAFGGRSNVGKSSLLNSLLNRKNLAQTSKTPGKTRLLNFFIVSGKGGKPQICFVDLPGFGYARVSVTMRRSWQSLVEGYIGQSSNLKGFLLLIDSRRGVNEEEILLVEYLLHHGKMVCPILTKSDKLNKTQKTDVVRETTKVLERFGEKVCFPILHSSKDGTGNDLIWTWMNERINDEI